jgi:cyclophilin family peptidyl-prolyl cis-trans isomerase
MKLQFLMVALIFASAATFAQKKAPLTQKKAPAVEGIFAEITTLKGTIVIDLNYKKTPLTVANFIALAEGTNPNVSAAYKGKKFYDGIKFHRVINDFMIQGGDPLGTGSGDPGYKFKDEITDLKHNGSGILSMANSGPNTNGSQFFITHKETPHLDGKHTVFGTVVSGMDVVNKIVQNDVMDKVAIVRRGAEAKKFDAPKVFASITEADKIASKKEALNRELGNTAILKEFANGKTTASGLKYIVIIEGTGPKPVSTSNVKVHYAGTLTNGSEFDSSIKRGEPIDFNLNQVIPGWTEGLQLMPEGSKYKFYIPYSLAYGERAMGNVIPSKSDLIFEVELIKINN